MKWLSRRMTKSLRLPSVDNIKDHRNLVVDLVMNSSKFQQLHLDNQKNMFERYLQRLVHVCIFSGLQWSLQVSLKSLTQNTGAKILIEGRKSSSWSLHWPLVLKELLPNTSLMLLLILLLYYKYNINISYINI